MSTRRRKKSRDHRRGKSIEDIAKEELSVIVDEDDITDTLGDIKEDMDMDEYNNMDSHSLSQSITKQISLDQGLRLSDTSISDDISICNNMNQLIDEINAELSTQYTPNAIPTTERTVSIDSNLSTHSIPQTNIFNRLNRSDSHYAASTPLVVRKYTNIELDSLVKCKKPALMNAAKDLPLLIDIKDENETHSILLQKLSLCEVLCDFRIVNDGYPNENNIDDFEANDIKIEQEIKCIDNKKAFLKECTKYLTKTKWSSIIILKQIFRTVQTNLFRSLPDSFIITEFQGIDNPPKYTLPKWKHLQFIYELMFQVIMNKQIDKKIICKYLTGSFLNNFVQLFHSICIAEVDYVKILIHSMYLDFVDLRDEIRISLSQYCWDFIYCNNGTSEGINAILDIMNSILQGLDYDKLNDPNKWYIVLCHVLCPLHKGNNFDKFEQTLYKCIKTFIKSQPEHFVVVFNHGLLKFWPLTNPAKEHMFVKEILNILKMVKRQKILCNDKFTNVFQSVIKQIRNNLLSTHYQIVNETIESLKEKLIRQCIDYHGGYENGWKPIYKSLIYATNNHYLFLTRDNSKQMLDWLKKYRITKKHVKLFEKLENEYSSAINLQPQKQLINTQSKWEPIIIMADKAKKKLYEKNNSININNDEIKEINNIFNIIEAQQKQENILAKAYMTEKDLVTYMDIEDINDTIFKYPQPIEQKLDIPSRPSMHRLVNSQPMPNSEIEILPKPIYKKRASQTENNYGYPQVHKIYKKYRETKSENCRNPTHLVLFAKKNGTKITFAMTNKYFKARKNAINTKKKIKKQKPLVPSAILTSNDSVNNNNNNNNSVREITNNINKYRRNKNNKRRSASSPITNAIRNEKKNKEKEIGIIEYNGHKSTRSGDSPYWSNININANELKGNTIKMNKIKENIIDNKMDIKTNFYMKSDENNNNNNINNNNNNKISSNNNGTGRSTPATPGTIKSNPMTPATPTYWSEMNKNKYNTDSLLANNISLK